MPPERPRRPATTKRSVRPLFSFSPGPSFEIPVRVSYTGSLVSTGGTSSTGVSNEVDYTTPTPYNSTVGCPTTAIRSSTESSCTTSSARRRGVPISPGQLCPSLALTQVRNSTDEVVSCFQLGRSNGRRSFEGWREERGRSSLGRRRLLEREFGGEGDRVPIAFLLLLHLEICFVRRY
ncbi:hypothetical protein BDY24DRAFT_389044 [Mrakia frigida]|uniref:uncharacterized protein n=1 Tax=Mrakia frigida TaxID=29902 RepID=UPI003FCBF0AB